MSSKSGYQPRTTPYGVFAVDEQFAIVTKGDDFRTKALLLAPPGKVILIALGNCETAAVESLFREKTGFITTFLTSEYETLLVIP